MRKNRRTITVQRHRDYGREAVANKVLTENKVLYFAKDPQVSSRILAVLQKGVSKDKVQLTERVKVGTKQITSFKNKKTRTVDVYKRIPKEQFNQIEKYQIICGSNGKVGTWYNTCELNKDNTIKSRKNVGTELTPEEFVKLYDSQCEIFKRIFHEEYKSILLTIKKSA